MTAILIILCSLVGVGLLLYIYDRFSYRDKTQKIDKSEKPVQDSLQRTVYEDSPQAEDVGFESEGGPEGGICCGLHLNCEKDSLSTSGAYEIEYYDDEELDRFAGRDPLDYNREEIEEFREILLTLLPVDIAGWSRSLQLRNINFPAEIREELLLIVSEARSK